MSSQEVYNVAACNAAKGCVESQVYFVVVRSARGAANAFSRRRACADAL